MGSNEAAAVALHESVWLNANRFYDAESRYYEVSQVALEVYQRRKNPGTPPRDSTKCLDMKLPIEEKQKKGESAIDSGACILNRLEALEKGNNDLVQKVEKLTADMNNVLSKLLLVEKSVKQLNIPIGEKTQVTKTEDSKVNIQNGSSAAADDDDDVDLFGSDEEDDAATKLREERLQAYANKKAKKPALVAKSSVVLDVKPWDDETDMKAMEEAVRNVQTDGLVWGASKLVPLAYGIKKLQIIAVVEDEKVSIDWLQDTICEIEDLVQSVDIAAFNKL